MIHEISHIISGTITTMGDGWALFTELPRG
jgi:hypothetical protein